jgi:hypothetical protein
MAKIKFVVKELNKPSAQTLDNFNRIVFDTIKSTLNHETKTYEEISSVPA